MKVLHVIIALHPGGAELMMKRLITPAGVDPQVEHRVVALREVKGIGPELEAEGIQVDIFGMKGLLGLPSVFRRLRRLIREYRPDIVQTWMYHGDLIGGLAARSCGFRNVIWGVRIADVRIGMGVSRSTLWIRKICAKLSRAIPKRIVYVAEAARRTHEALGYDSSKGIVIPNGYEMPPAKDAATAAAVRRELGIAEDSVLIASAGRYNAQKDHKGLVSAGAILAERYPRATFLLMGRGVDESNEELTGWVRASGHAGRFRLAGERRDLARCLAAADIFCLHSLAEGFPNVVAEAMAVGVPCAVTDVGDAALIVGETGEVVPAAQPAAMAGALARLIDRGAEGRAALGAQARRRITGEFSIEAIRARYRGLYDALAGTPEPTGRRERCDGLA